MVTICPYKLVLLAVTVIFAALVAWHGADDSKKRDDDDDDDDEVEVDGFLTRLLRGDPVFTGIKTRHPVAYRTCYTLCVFLLVVFHFEIFTGGWVCRTLFVGSNATAAVAANVSASASALASASATALAAAVNGTC